MIDSDLPASAENWPDGVLASLKNFRQGDLVASPSMAYLSDPAAPVCAESLRFAAEIATAGEPMQADVIHLPEQLQPPYGMITTQTCDIVEEDSPKPICPWVQLAPVYEMTSAFNSGERKQLARGGGALKFLHVPALSDGFYVADFRLSFPVEKGWLSLQDCVEGFGTEELRERVGHRVALLGGRPAFGGRFVVAIQRPLIQALRSLKSTDLELFNRIDRDVPELGVRLDSRLDPTTAQVVVVCETPLDEDEITWWHDWWDSCREIALQEGITLQVLDFKNLDESFSAAEYRALTHLPLAYVSPE